MKKNDFLKKNDYIYNVRLKFVFLFRKLNLIIKLIISKIWIKYK